MRDDWGVAPGQRRGAWFSCPDPRPRNQIRLFCFPYAGGGAAVFRGWPSLLPPTVELWVVHMPGREQRIAEDPHASIDDLVSAVCEAFTAETTQPFAFFGHSMGALVAYELVRRLRQRQLPAPRCLVVSAHRAPHLEDSRPRLAELADPEFIGALRRLNGTPLELFEQPELLDLVLPLLRADFKAVESYVYVAEEPLSCPIVAYAGTDDADVPPEEVVPWRQHTTEEYRMRCFPGNHFYLQDDTASVVRVLAGDVLAYAGWPR